MEDAKKWAPFAFVFLVGAVLGWWLHPTCGPLRTSYIERVRWDTQWIVKQIPAQEVKAARGTSRPQTPSDADVYGPPTPPAEVRPFVAEKTAIFGADSVTARYWWPQELWDIRLAKGPDSSSVITKTVEKTTTEYVAVPEDDRWGLSLMAGLAWGINDLNAPPLSLSNVRVGIGVTYDIFQW